MTPNERRSRPRRLADWFYKYSFIWWPVLLAGVAYPAKVVSGLREDTKETVHASEQRLQVQIDTLKVQVQAGNEDRKQINDKLDALLRKACADQTPREKVLTGTATACAKAGAN